MIISKYQQTKRSNELFADTHQLPELISDSFAYSQLTACGVCVCGVYWWPLALRQFNYKLIDSIA